VVGAGQRLGGHGGAEGLRATRGVREAAAAAGLPLQHVHQVGDEEVVEEDVGGHGPELQAHSAEGGHAEGMQVLEEVRVGNLAGLPHALSGGEGLG